MELMLTTRRLLWTLATLAVLGTTAAGAQTAPNSAALTLEVKPAVGTQAVQVQGSGPAGGVVTIALYNTVSRDVPTVFVSQQTLVAGSDGHFAGQVRTAPAYMPGSLLTVVASAPGAATAQATLVLQAPNAPVSVPAETTVLHDP